MSVHRDVFATAGGIHRNVSQQTRERDWIERVIPQRGRILILERVLELEPGVRGVGERTFDAGDPCFEGHFPERPILPGIYIVEGCGQLLGVVCQAAGNESQPSDTPRLGFLASIERFKFTSSVTPGETLRMEAQVGRRVGNLVQGRVAAFVGNRAVAEGILNVASAV